jgi:hypothetical protein
MASTVANKRFGPETYSVVEAVNAGAFPQLVEARTATSNVGVAAADSAAVLGVALYPALPAGSDTGAGTTYGGMVSQKFDVPTDEVAVAYTGTFKLKAVGAIAFGADVKAAASGQVATIGASAFGLRVGRCVEPGGIASGATGRIRLMLS